MAFCKNVLTELFDLFPSQYVHIGGDEVERTPWETCPDCQRRIRAEKLEGAGELQAWFTRKTEQFLAAHGKTLLGWDEITEDGLTPQSAVMWWRRLDALHPDRGAPERTPRH
ncbi:MAG: family 20 glycosylhydrolase [Alistipes finegoldii]